MVLSFPFLMPPRQNPSTDVTLPSIREQLSTLIVISTANLRRLDAIITQMATVNTLIGSPSNLRNQISSFKQGSIN
ncbi:unnamed protein product [Lactuca virosa]|uniref:Uncharacterized protein n=1 Tax=Lactuca virosa TaxID=75947 RepID=A0AAU9MRT2_9ASTR|nr:unnamed protein product [Lactuca virosa]